MKHTNLLLLLASSFLFACSGDNKYEGQAEAKSSDTLIFVKPPIPGVNIEKELFTVKAENGDTLYSKSGSIILFPQNSMVDENGTLIKGDVQISYREFNDPVDFFVSGIPMNYDSGGVSYDFKSAGMCELKATKDGKEVFVNQQSKPEVNMVSNDEDPEFNLYYLDEKKKGWQAKGKDNVTNLDLQPTKEDAKGKSNVKATNPKVLTEAPVKPNKVTDPSKVIEIEIAPGDYPELSAYNNIKFEIEKSEKFSPKDAEEEWNEVKVTKTVLPGLYSIKFSNAKRTVSYKARPVLDGKDYATALKVFEAKNKEYEKMLADRVNRENKIIADAAKKDAEADAMIAKNKITAEENARIDKMNVLIAARNKDIDATNKMILEANRKVEEQKKVFKAQQEASLNYQKEFAAKMQAEADKWARIGKVQELIIKKEEIPSTYTKEEIAEANKIIAEEAARIERQKEMEKNAKEEEKIVRSFQVDGFGIWNCDQPILTVGIKIKTSFKVAGEKVDIPIVSVVLKKFNGLVRYAVNDPVITVTENGNCAIFGTKDGFLLYMSPEDFAGCRISKETKEYTFELKKSQNKISSVEEVRVLVGI